MNQKTIAKFLLPLVFLTFTCGCSTVKGWFGKKKNRTSPRRSWPRKASRI